MILLETNFYSILKEFEFFSFLKEEELEKFERNLFHRTYKKNQILFTEGDPRERIYLLIDGYVKLDKTNLEATTTYTYYIKPKELFPYRGMFHNDYYNCSAYAMTDIEVHYIPTKIFESFAKENKDQLYFIINQLSKILYRHENRLQISLSNYAKDKVELGIAYLMKYFGDHDGHDIKVELPMTIKELSLMLGVSRESVSACYGELKRENLLSENAKRIIIHNPEYFNKKLT